MKHIPLYLMTFVLFTFIVFGCRRELQLDPLDKSTASGLRGDSTGPIDTTHPHPGDTTHPHPGDTTHPHPGDTTHPHPGDTTHPHPVDTTRPHPGDSTRRGILSGRR